MNRDIIKTANDFYVAPQKECIRVSYKMRIKQLNIMEQINYQDVIDLGFKRKNMNDHIFEQQNGYGWFLVRMKLYKGIVAEWSCETRTVEIVRYKKINVQQRLQVSNLENLKNYIGFFTKKAR